MNAMYPSKESLSRMQRDADLDETAETEILLDNNVCVWLVHVSQE